MSFRINVRGTSWGLIYREVENSVRKDRRIKQSDLLQYGLRPDMTVDEAKARAKQLNAETRYTRREEKSKQRALAAADLERGLNSKHFPPALVAEFERTRLKTKFEFAGENPEAKYKKALSRWRYARRMVIELDVKVEDWADEPRVFYRYFIGEKISLDYVGKVLSVLNMWGHFIAKKQGRAFLPIPSPRGHDREAIADAYLESDKRKKDSLPLTPELLESVREKLRPEYYNWLFISLWFGLRPKELGSQWKVIHEGKLTALAVYQSKLTTIAKDKRWKYIPLLYPEQKKAHEMLEKGLYKRLPASAVARAFPDGYTLYMGRKGFTNLMLDRGQHFEDVSSWLGHLNVNQTFRTYKDRTRISLRKAG